MTINLEELKKELKAEGQMLRLKSAVAEHQRKVAAEKKSSEQTEAIAKQKQDIALAKARFDGIRAGYAMATKAVDSTTPAPILKETKHLVRKIATNTYEPSRLALQQVFDAEYDRALKDSAS